MPSATRPTALFAFLAAVAVAGVTMLTAGTQASATVSHTSAHAAVVAADSDSSAVSPADLTWG